MTAGNETPIRLLLLDDHRLFRAGLRAMLEQFDDFRVVGEAEDAHAAYALLDSARPHVAVVDVRLQGIDGIGATRELIRRDPRLRVAMLSALREPDYAAEAFAAGALGYLVKNESLEDCLTGLRAVARGERFISPTLPAADVDRCFRVTREDAEGRGQVFQVLSKREREVFHLLIHGSRNQQIASELFISVKTVESHREHILKKLGCHSIVELMRYASRHALVD